MSEELTDTLQTESQRSPLPGNPPPRNPSAAPFASNARRSLILCLLLATCTLALYNRANRNSFVNYDDDVYVTANHAIQSGLNSSTIRWAFTTFDASNWHPLTWVSHAIDYQLFKLNPAGHHFTNVVLHCASVVILFLILMQATQRVWPSLVLAAIFAVHPLNVESVAWAAERKNVLSMLFLLLALWAYQRYARKPRLLLYASVVLCFAAGLMAKPQVITLPLLMLLWDYWPLNRIRPRSTISEPSATRSFTWLIVEKIPLLLLSIASALITMAAQRHGGAVRSVIEYPFAVRIGNAVAAYFDYAGRFVWPVRLAAMYPHPGDSLRHWQIGLAAAFLFAISALVFRFRSKPYLTVGWLWFLGSLVPMSGLVQVGQQATADRYMYLPMIGLLIMMCWSFADWADGYRLRRVTISCACAVALAALIALSYRQIGYWHDSETLWRHAIAVTKNNYVAHINLGETLLDHGRAKEAAVSLRAALQIRPSEASAHLNLGTCERQQQNYVAALQEDQAVLRLTSDQGLRAYALVNMGSDYRLLKDYEHSKESYQAGLSLNPEAARALIGLGLLAGKGARYDEAVRDYARAIELEPSDVGYLLLSDALKQTGQLAASQQALAEAQRVSPDFDLAQQAVRDMQSE